jgi:tetratricopeptide (TPR) repeat protein
MMTKELLEKELAKGALKISIKEIAKDLESCEDIDMILTFAKFCDENSANKYAIESYEQAIRLSDDESFKADTFNTIAGIYFMKMQNIKKTVEVSHYAIAIYRRLAKNNPVDYNEPLANLLNNLSSISYQSIDKEVALDLAIEAFDLSLFLMSVDAKKYLYLLEHSTQNGISIALDLGDGDALKYLFAKSIEVFREASDSGDEVFIKKLDYYTKALEEIEDRL